MLKNNKQIEIVNQKLEKIVFWVGKKAFFVFLVLIFISLLIGSMFFYKYAYLVEKANPTPSIKSIILNKELHQEFLENYSLRVIKFHESNLKEYPNFFK